MGNEQEFYLDWKKDFLMGWENGKSRLVVLSMIEGIKLGHKFPEVDVVRVADRKYNMVCWWGNHHHVAIAHCITNSPLRSSLWEDNPWGNDKVYVSIKDVRLSDYINSVKLINSLRHLPREIAENFCLENGLDFSKYLSQ